MGDITMNPVWNEIFTTEEISKIKDLPRHHQRHPLQRIIFPKTYGSDFQVATNTEKALGSILRTNSQWVAKLKTRLLNLSDYSTSSAALGEIRAYGYLLDADINVFTIPTEKKPTPEFRCSIDNTDFLMEVHSKQMHGDESKALSSFNEKPSSGDIVVTPFGKAKQDEATTQNAISKLCSIKQREHQLSGHNPSIMWMDFQDETWDRVFLPENAFPIRSVKGEFNSGALWYAFYGWKTAPIYENHSFEIRNEQRPVLMGHEGRFRIGSNIHTIIVAFPKHTIFFENPYIDKNINLLDNTKIWAKLAKIKWFSVEYSWTKQFKGDLQKQIEIERSNILALSNLLKYKW